MNRAWRTLERGNDEKFPKCIKLLLKSAGYDTMTSLSELCDDTIKNIETFHQNRKNVIESLDCCYSEFYKTLDPFCFLPGHKAILLGLPKKIQKIKEKNITNIGSSSRNRTKNQANIIVSNRLESDDELKSKLIDNTLKIIKKLSTNDVQTDVVGDVHIIDFERVDNSGNFVCKCIFQCPFCVRKIPVGFKKYWQTSNLGLHLKGHF